MKQHPRVGIGVIIIRDNNVLFGKRKNAHGDGTWCFPGGHLEFRESLEDCALREVMEETGLTVKNPRFATLTNDIFPEENKHYVTVFMVADYTGGDPEVCEPDRCERWEWFAWDALPQPLFIPIQNLLQQSFNPFKT